MAGKLTQAEELAHAVAHKVADVVAERDVLRRELARMAELSVERTKAYVCGHKAMQMCRENARLRAYVRENVIYMMD